MNALRRLFQRKHRCRKRVPVMSRAAVIVNAVPAAKLPNEELERESRALEISFIEKLMAFGRKSAENRELLLQNTLAELK